MRYYTPIKLSENIHETPEGFLVCVGVPIARTGYQTYLKGEIPLEAGPDGRIQVYRDPSVVFNPETIASFEGKPFTIDHPKENVDPMNWKDLAKGVIQNVRKSPKKDQDGEESLLADILITDVLAIQLVKAGLREVSCGYQAIYEQTGEGTGKQTNIIGNHLALVRAGRAGPSYAIHDHKPERYSMSKLKEKLKGLFTKAIDEAVDASVAEETQDKTPTTDNQAKDITKDDGGKVEKKADGSVSYDELHSMVKDLGEKVSGLLQVKDKEEEGKEDKKEGESKDANEAEMSMEKRLGRVEKLLAKLLEVESLEHVGDEGMEGKEDPKQVGDSKPEEDDVDEEVASRAEILSPGIRITKDVKSAALKASYSTTDGKAIIDSLTGGKAPDFKSEQQVSNLFIATSEIIKAKRGTGLEKTKNPRTFDSAMKSPEVMTPAKLNEIHEKFYKQNNQ